MIGREARAQILRAEGKLPTAIIACVGGGSNAIGIFHEFIKDKKVQLIGVEAGGRGQVWANMQRASVEARRAFCKARTRTCCRMRLGRFR